MDGTHPSSIRKHCSCCSTLPSSVRPSCQRPAVRNSNPRGNDYEDEDEDLDTPPPRSRESLAASSVYPSVISFPRTSQSLPLLSHVLAQLFQILYLSIYPHFWQSFTSRREAAARNLARATLSPVNAFMEIHGLLLIARETFTDATTWISSIFQCLSS